MSRELARVGLIADSNVTNHLLYIILTSVALTFYKNYSSIIVRLVPREKLPPVSQLRIGKMLPNLLRTLGALLLLVSVAHAQFQFFEQMFGGGGGRQEQQRASQNVPSDSSRYQSMWEGCTYSKPSQSCTPASD